MNFSIIMGTDPLIIINRPLQVNHQFWPHHLSQVHAGGWVVGTLRPLQIKIGRRSTKPYHRCMPSKQALYAHTVVHIENSWQFSPLMYHSTEVSCPDSLSHAEKESSETRTQFWFPMYVCDVLWHSQNITVCACVIIYIHTAVLKIILLSKYHVGGWPETNDWDLEWLYLFYHDTLRLRTLVCT